MGYKGSVYLPLSTDFAVILLCTLSRKLTPVAQYLCCLRPVARPSWPELARRPARSTARVGIQPPTVMPVHDGCPSAILYPSIALACSSLTAESPAAATRRSRPVRPPFHCDAGLAATASALFASADLGYNRAPMVRRRLGVVDCHHGMIEPARQRIPTAHRHGAV